MVCLFFVKFCRIEYYEVDVGVVSFVIYGLLLNYNFDLLVCILI